jgi:hypothetical protein
MNVIQFRRELLPRTEFLALFFHVDRHTCSSQKADASSSVQMIRGVYREWEILQ